MKTKVFILRADNTFYSISKKKLEHIIKIGKFSYAIDSNTIFYKIKKGIFGNVYRAVFLSEANVNPVKTKDGNVIQTNHITNNTSPADYIYQDLLHSKVISDVINPVEESMLKLLLGVGVGVLLGLLMGLALGHVRL